MSSHMPSTTQKTSTTSGNASSGTPAILAQHWQLVAGVATAIILGASVFVIVAIVIKKYKKKRNDQLTYYYSELTQELADDREITDDDMLVA